MKKSTRILSTVLALAVVSSLFTACNNQKDDETEPTTSETKETVAGTIDEPDQSIADSEPAIESESSETTASTTRPAGPYTYEAYGYQFTMDVYIDDYIKMNPKTGHEYFDIYQLAEEYGWIPQHIDGSTDYDESTANNVTAYSYRFKDGEIEEGEYSDANLAKRDGTMWFIFDNRGSDDNPLNLNQLYQIQCCRLDSTTAEKQNWGDPRANTWYLRIPNHSADEEWYFLSGAYNTPAVIRDDIILLAYIISVEPQYIGDDDYRPLGYTDYIDSDNIQNDIYYDFPE